MKPILLAAFATLVTTGAAERRGIAAKTRRIKDNNRAAKTPPSRKFFLRLSRSDQGFASDKEFVPAAVHMLRQILVEYARARNCLKRGGGSAPSSFDERYVDELYVAISPDRHIDLEALDDALTRLATVGERQARVVELRFFGGLTVEGSAAVLHVFPKTVKRDWVTARAWLRSYLLHRDAL